MKNKKLWTLFMAALICLAPQFLLAHDPEGMALFFSLFILFLIFLLSLIISLIMSLAVSRKKAPFLKKFLTSFIWGTLIPTALYTVIFCISFLPKNRTFRVVFLVSILFYPIVIGFSIYWSYKKINSLSQNIP